MVSGRKSGLSVNDWKEKCQSKWVSKIGGFQKEGSQK